VVGKAPAHVAHIAHARQQVGDYFPLERQVPWLGVRRMESGIERAHQTQGRKEIGIGRRAEWGVELRKGVGGALIGVLESHGEPVDLWAEWGAVHKTVVETG